MNDQRRDENGEFTRVMLNSVDYEAELERIETQDAAVDLEEDFGGYWGQEGFRDPEARCEMFRRGDTTLGSTASLQVADCQGDGHCLCRECVQWIGEPDD